MLASLILWLKHNFQFDIKKVCVQPDGHPVVWLECLSRVIPPGSREVHIPKWGVPHIESCQCHSCSKTKCVATVSSLQGEVDSICTKNAQKRHFVQILPTTRGCTSEGRERERRDAQMGLNFLVMNKLLSFSPLHYTLQVQITTHSAITRHPPAGESRWIMWTLSTHHLSIVHLYASTGWRPS